jgi:hypothetical protein
VYSQNLSAINSTGEGFMKNESEFTAKSIKYLRLTCYALLSFLFANIAISADLRVMKMGLGTGTIASSSPGINCGGDCDESYGPTTSVTLNASPASGSNFLRWEGDCSGTSSSCTFSVSSDSSVRAIFELSSSIPLITDFTASGIQAYLTANSTVDSVSKFIAALPDEYKQNWILMSRSESLQTGTADMPRILMPSADTRFVFSLGLSTHSSYPGSHPNAIEYMQWDAVQKNFRFHEIVLDTIPVLDPDGDGVGSLPARSRGVIVDDEKCSRCHSTRNIINDTGTAGTDGITPGTVPVKNKPNWDPYDSWGGMSPFNRDRIYQGSVEAAAFRKTFNLWTWRNNDFVRAIIEQLQLQPPSVPADDVITRTNGGANDGHINFSFDSSPPVLTEPAPIGTSTITTNYQFDNTVSGTATTVQRDGDFVTLHHSISPGNDEGRGVQLFDTLGGLDGNLNQTRIADEVDTHSRATGNVNIDVTPVALAISKSCFTIGSGTITSSPSHTIDLSFFTARNGMGINDLVTDTRTRVESLPRRKADIQKINLDRSGDIYTVASTNGQIQEFGAATAAGTIASLERIRQEVFRRATSGSNADSTVMGGIYVDRESYSYNINRVALYRYFLEPLGVSVDKWSLGTRGRSRSYAFADVFSTYANVFEPTWSASLGLASGYTCSDIIPLVNSSLASLPAPDAVPTYTDVQRIFNKSCIECHGDLDYPPYQNHGSFLNLSENEAPTGGEDKLDRSHSIASNYVSADPSTSTLYTLITETSEDCPFPGGSLSMMPCGGPPLSKTDTETIRRWIIGGSPNTRGDPHIKTIDGVHYDFQAAGEFVLLRDTGFEIQTRQTAVETNSALGPNSHTGLTSCVSLNNAVAVKVGPHRISYQPALSREPNPEVILLRGQQNSEGLQLRIDGKVVKMRNRGIQLAAGGRVINTSVENGIQIQAPGGSTVTITPKWWSSYQVWYMNIDVQNARATQGLMGNIATNNWLPALPDGTWLGPRPKDLLQRYNDLYNTFGNAWRVTNSNSLFDYAPGISTANFTVSSWPMGESPSVCEIPPNEGVSTLPPVKGMALAQAKQHCQNIQGVEDKKHCTQDVMVTGESGFAETYLASEKLELNNKPMAPVLNFPAIYAKDLIAPIDFTWQTTSDVEGEGLTYWYCLWPSSEKQTYRHCKIVHETPPNDKDGSNVLSNNQGLWGLLLSILIFLLVIALIKKRFAISVLLLIIILLLLFFMFSSNSTTNKHSTENINKTVNNLVSGKTYFWKIIVEDEQGGTTESETRRFTVK